MSRIAYVDGRYTLLPEASVGIEDRGLQFADSIYEVWGVRAGRLRDEAAHFTRLHRSLGELRIPEPMGEGALRAVLGEVIRRNRLRDGLLYLQITRGEARRDHAFPAGVSPTVIVTAARVDPAALRRRAETGISVATLPDQRWGRCDIKSTALLPNVLAKQAARDQGASEAWLYDSNGMITEGSSTNAWIVVGDRRVATRPIIDNILSGVTRLRVIEVAARLGIAVEERAFSVDEAKAAPEAFLTASSGGVTPVVMIDGAPVGAGRPGAVTRALQAGYDALTD